MSSSTAARRNGCTRSTGRGERNSAQTRITTTGAPMPTTMLQGRCQVATPQSAREATATTSTTARMTSMTVMTGRSTPGTGVGSWGMDPVYSAGTGSSSGTTTTSGVTAVSTRASVSAGAVSTAGSSSTGAGAGCSTGASS